jgi:hypothetical protein
VKTWSYFINRDVRFEMGVTEKRNAMSTNQVKRILRDLTFHMDVSFRQVILGRVPISSRSQLQQGDLATSGVKGPKFAPRRGQELH